MYNGFDNADAQEGIVSKTDNIIRPNFGWHGGSNDDTETIPVDTAQTPTPPSIPDLFGWLLDSGLTAVTLDSRVEGVQVPEQYANMVNLTLNFSTQFHIKDFEFDDESVRASLRYDGVNHYTVVPWAAVYHMGAPVLPDGVFIAANIPPEITAMFSEMDEAVEQTERALVATCFPPDDEDCDVE